MMDEVRSTARMPIIICGLSCLFAPSRVTLKLIVDLTPGLYMQQSLVKDSYR